MSAQTSFFVPWPGGRKGLADALEDFAANLSSLLDQRLNCFLPGFAKAEAVKEMMPDRRLVLEAQQCALSLRQTSL